jgi:predicted RNA-binding protein with PIN domain
MALIIDGYNLLFAIGLPVGSGGPHGLRTARGRLLEFLTRSLAPHEIGATVVVFDSAQAVGHLPQQFHYRGIEVRFAAQHATADDLIEELIRQESVPRRLTVVSSDHRLQQAARRRRAIAVDSEAWYEALLERKGGSGFEPPADEPADSTTEDEAETEKDFWLRTFDTDEDPIVMPDDPFPPGYGDDLES